MGRTRATMPKVEDVHGAALSVVDVVGDDAPAVPPVPDGPLSEDDARALTERIRLTATVVRERFERLAQLVQQARTGGAHEALGYASWTAYLADVLGGQMRLAGDERREMVRLLTSEGMSTRAIAPIVGASPKTVARDVLEVAPPVSDDTPAPVTGVDGKTYTRKPRPVDRCGTCGASGDELCVTADGEDHKMRTRSAGARDARVKAIRERQGVQPPLDAMPPAPETKPHVVDVSTLDGVIDLKAIQERYERWDTPVDAILRRARQVYAATMRYEPGAPERKVGVCLFSVRRTAGEECLRWVRQHAKTRMASDLDAAEMWAAIDEACDAAYVGGVGLRERTA